MSTKKITKYHNDFNKVSLSGWNSLEMDFLFSAFTAIKDQGTNEVIIPMSDFKELADYTNRNSYRYIDIMGKLQEKAFAMVYIDIKKEPLGDGKGKVTMTPMRVFDDFNIVFDEDYETDTVLDGYVRVVVSKDFEYLINKLVGNFTYFELREFTDLSSVYAKTAYRLFKQWKTVGERKFSIEEFRAVFGVPSTYSMSNITQRVLNPILKELTQIEPFKDLQVEKIKKRSKGSPVIGLVFTWKPEKVEGWNPNKYTAKKEHEKNTTSDKIGDYLKDKMLEDFKASQKSLTEDQLNIDNFKDL